MMARPRSPEPPQAVRPRSIVRYERLYLAGFACSLVGWALSWDQLMMQVARLPRGASLWWAVPASLAVTVAITLALWFMTARRASLVAKWLVVLLAAFGAVRMVVNLPAFFAGRIAGATFGVAALTAALSVAAAALLFRPDARAWFGEDVHGDLPEDAPGAAA